MLRLNMHDEVLIRLTKLHLLVFAISDCVSSFGQMYRHRTAFLLIMLISGHVSIAYR